MKQLPPISQVFGGPSEQSSSARHQPGSKAQSVIVERADHRQARLMKNRNFNNLPSFLQIGKPDPDIKDSSGYGGKRTVIPVDANILSKGDTFEHLGMIHGNPTKS